MQITLRLCVKCACRFFRISPLRYELDLELRPCFFLIFSFSLFRKETRYAVFMPFYRGDAKIRAFVVLGEDSPSISGSRSGRSRSRRISYPQRSTSKWHDALARSKMCKARRKPNKRIVTNFPACAPARRWTSAREFTVVYSRTLHYE